MHLCATLQVAAIAETPEYRMAIRKNARLEEGILFSTFCFLWEIREGASLPTKE